MAVPCESCGSEPATTRTLLGSRLDQDRRWLGPACLRKEVNRRRGSWLELLQNPGDPPADRPAGAAWDRLDAGCLARDFTELAGDGDLGLIVADGDGVGRILETLDPLTELNAFSEGLDRHLRGTVRRALQSVLRPWLATILAGEHRLPVEVLYRGGDDLVIACRGSLALPLAAHLIVGFRGGTDWSWAGGRPIGLSAGVVVTGAAFPFRTAHEIADGLLREAKRAALEGGGKARGEGAVDFAVISESFADLPGILATRSIGTGAEPPLYLTGRPYRAAARGPRSVGSLYRACRILDRSAFPRSRLFDLRRDLNRESLLTDPSATLTPDEFGRGRAWLRRWVDTWTARTCRTEPLRRAWDRTRQALGVDATGHYPDAGPEQGSRTPLSDLADALALWGFRS
jgi:hypothetical protein